MARALIFASTNTGKVLEVSRAAEHLGLKISGLSDLSGIHGSPPEVTEGEPTYEKNAARKARIYSHWCRQNCIADDTGLEVAVLSNRPGVHTAHYGIPRFLRELRAIGGRSPARFICSMAYAEPQGRVVTVTASIEGAVSHTDDAGWHDKLPYSAYFIPDGEERSLAELVPLGYETHRVKAFLGLLKALGWRE